MERALAGERAPRTWRQAYIGASDTGQVIVQRPHDAALMEHSALMEPEQGDQDLKFTLQPGDEYALFLNVADSIRYQITIKRVP